MIVVPPISSRSHTLWPNTTIFRSPRIASGPAPDSGRAAEKGRSPAATVACRQRFGSKIATGGNLQPLLSLLAHGKPRRKQDERQRHTTSTDRCAVAHRRPRFPRGKRRVAPQAARTAGRPVGQGGASTG